MKGKFSKGTRIKSPVTGRAWKNSANAKCTIRNEKRKRNAFKPTILVSAKIKVHTEHYRRELDEVNHKMDGLDGSGDTN